MFLQVCNLVLALSSNSNILPFKKEVKDRAVILISPDEDLRNGPDRLHQQPLVALRDCLVLAQHRVEILELLQAVEVPRSAPEATHHPPQHLALMRLTSNNQVV